MKTNKIFFRLWIAVAILISGLLLTPSCSNGNDDSVGSGNEEPGGGDEPGGGGDEPSTTLEVTITGSISHTDYDSSESGTVSFNRFPATVAEFQKVRDRIGGEPHGAVALQVMAYEMYRRNADIGTECIKLNNTTNNVNLAVSRLKELFGNDVNYARPYQMAAYLKDATWDNGYSPSKPYTVEVEVSKVHNYQYSNDYQNTVIYLNILTQGKPSGYDSVEVLKTSKPGEPSEGNYFIVLNCPGLYSQVRAISFDTPFQGLD